MKNILFFLSIVFCQLTYGQADTTKIYNCHQYKKGFYKSYAEYINNSPSVTIPFTVVPQAKSSTDTSIIGADYRLQDSLKRVSHVWGFCDGTDIYVAYNNALFTKRYWKLQSVGIYSFFTFKNKQTSIVPVALLAVNAGPAAITPSIAYNLLIIDGDGLVRVPTISMMKMLLINQPDLLKSFNIYAKRYQSSQPHNYESAQTTAEKMSMIKDYLIRLNEVSK